LFCVIRFLAARRVRGCARLFEGITERLGVDHQRNRTEDLLDLRLVEPLPAELIQARRINPAHPIDRFADDVLCPIRRSNQMGEHVLR
jgi:hypothetical protein